MKRMLDTLETYDRSLFLYLNGLHQDWLDPIMHSVSDKLFWLPVYLFIFFLVQRQYGWKNLGWFALGIALIILFCDQISSSFLKPYFARYRPCNNQEISHMVHRVYERCGSGYSFVSGHATNYFGISLFAAMVFKNTWGYVLLLSWAALIAYSRVYLGVHYPGDILAGAILGVAIAILIFVLNQRICERSQGKYGLDLKHPLTR
jgi:undecaprenyl-diphosphatase